MADKTPIEIEQENRQKFAEAAKTAGFETDDAAVATPDAEAEDKSNGGSDPKDTQPSLDSGKNRQDPTEPADGGDNSEKAKSPDKAPAPANVEPTDTKPDNGVEDDIPAAMSKKHAEKWKTLDPDMKAEVKRVLENDQQTITRFKTKNKSLEDAIAVANPEIYADVKNFGMTREQSIKNRLSLVSRFERNPDETFIGCVQTQQIKLHNPAGFIRAIAASHNIDLETLTKVDPKVAALEDRNAAYEARQRAAKDAENARVAAQNAAIDDEIVEAAKGFLSNHPEIQMTEMFKAQMDAVAMRILQQKPNISSAELFEDAYAVVRSISQPAQPAAAVKPTPEKTVIPKKSGVSLKPSDDAGEKPTRMSIDVNDPNARRKLFNQIAKATGFGPK